MVLILPSMAGLKDSKHVQSLLSSLSEQRMKGMFCDITIIVEDVKFKAHRNVLAASSAYFRNAFASTQEQWVPSQVLELLDLRSEVFASILNFIYTSTVAPMAAEDMTCLVVAGKKLGIPFLESLSIQDKQASATSHQATSPKQTQLSARPRSMKREVVDSSTGPRITNAFSITEIVTGNNPLFPLDLRSSGRKSHLSGQMSVGFLSPNSTPPPSEVVHTLADHSYAVSQTCKSTGNSESNDYRNGKDVQQKQVPTKLLSGQNCNPFKKNQKLLGVSIPETPVLSSNSNAFAPTTSSSLLSSFDSKNQSSTRSELLLSRNKEEPFPSAESCAHASCSKPCFETFSNHNPALHNHKEIQKNRFGCYFSCKFCHRKFIHLKRLRNHEQLCRHALTPILGTSLTPNTALNMGDGVHSVPSSSLSELPNLGARLGDPCDKLQEAENGSQLTQGRRRVYPCRLCKRAYMTLSSLKRHENVHLWHRTYPCHYCNKVFALAEYRTKHEIWHTGERRYQCIFCLETFMTYYILKNHQKSFHGIETQLAAKQKLANNRFKGSVYPVKLYRLLPMKFRKRQYETYSQALLKVAGANDQRFHTHLPCSSSSAAFLTYMATPKVVASVQPLSSEGESCPQTEGTFKVSEPVWDSAQAKSGQRGLSENEGSVSVSSSGSDAHILSGQGLNSLSSLGHHSASAHSTDAGRAMTYIAKPACSGPAFEGRVPPLCQITMKIGNEAIVCRRIKGTTLFPSKRKRTHWNQVEVESQRNHGLCMKASLSDLEPNDDSTRRDTLWRPYYSYKHKKKAKKSGRRRSKYEGLMLRHHAEVTAEPQSIEGHLETGHSSDHNFQSLPNAVKTEKYANQSIYPCDICQNLPCGCNHGTQNLLGEVPGSDRPLPQGDNSCFNGAARSPQTEKRYCCSFCPQRFLYLATKRSHEKKHLEKTEAGEGTEVTARDSAGLLPP